MKQQFCLYLSSFFAIAAGIFPLAAQTPDEVRPRFGITIQPAVNIHSSDFIALPGVPNCCPQFTGGEGFGIGFGLLAEFPIAKRWWIGGRGMFATQGATLTSNESTNVLIDGTQRIGTFEHSLATGLSAVAFEPIVIFNPIGRFRLLAGGRAGFFLSGTYNQKETILEPNLGVFTDTRTRSRNEYSGDIPQLQSFQAGLLFGIAQELPLNRKRTLYLQPEIIFSLALTPVASGVSSWSAHALRFGLSLKYAPPVVPVDTTAKPPTANEQTPVIAHNTTTDKTPAAPPKKGTMDNGQRGMDKEPTENTALTLTVRSITGAAQNPSSPTRSALPASQNSLPDSRVHIEEFISRQMRPLLNYIFFDNNSFEIPNRYSQLSPPEATHFRVEALRGKDVLPTYYELLNIIGRRMTDRPTSTLTLTGCNSDEGTEQGNTILSSRRAEAIRRYFTEIWGISAARISVKRRGKPERPTTGIAEAAEDAAAENRRVEITSNDAAILAPFISADTTRMAVTSKVELRLSAPAPSGDIQGKPSAQEAKNNKSPKAISSFEILANGKLLRRIEGDSNGAHWNIALEPTDVLNTLAAVREIKFRASAHSGETVEATAPVELTTLSRKRSSGTADREIDRYRLILFDFDDAGLTAANRSATALIRENIRSGSTVEVRGYTDRMGDESYNRTLSSDRARAAARALGLPESAAAGDGETLLYDNDLPEGRFYNRTVHVTVETPVQ